MDENEQILRGVLTENGYNVIQLIGYGGNAMVFSCFNKENTQVAVKITLPDHVINNDFKERCWNEFKLAWHMARIDVGIPVYRFTWTGTYAIMEMALAEPLMHYDVLDRNYFYDIFYRIYELNTYGFWCADLKYINTVRYNNEYYLIDFDQEFCETTNNNFWNQVKTIIRHYKLPFPEPLNYYHPFGLQNDYNEFHHRFLAECYIFYKYAEQFNKANKRPDGYIDAAINVILHPPQGETNNSSRFKPMDVDEFRHAFRIRF